MNNKRAPHNSIPGVKKSKVTITGVLQETICPTQTSINRFFFVLIICGLVLCTFFSFRDTGTFEFLSFDDPLYVSQNRQVMQGLQPEGIVWAFTTEHAAYWIPITWISHMTDWQLFGNQPGKHHLMNVALHTINALLVFLLLMYMTGFMWRSAMVAFLFAMHPIHVESVAWVSERKDMLSALFWLSTTIAYVWYTRKTSWKRMIAVVVLFAMGIMSKPMVVTLPFTLLLLDYWPLNRLKTGGSISQIKKLPSLVIEKWLLFTMIIVPSVATFLFAKSVGAVSDIGAISIPMRFANAALSYVKYILKMFWPDPLSPFYYLELHHINSILVCGAVFLLFALTIIFWFSRKKKPYLLTGWLWYLGTLVPVIGIVQVGLQAMADRFTYIPLLGLFIIIVWLFSDFFRFFRYRTILCVTVALFIIIAMMVKTKDQVLYWKNTVTLFSHALKIDPQSEFPNYYMLGVTYMQQNDLANAQKCFENALLYNPNPQSASALSGNAYCLMQMGNFADAEKYLEHAMRVESGNKDFMVIMAYYYLNTGKPDLAIPYCDRVLASDSEMVTAYDYRTQALMALGRFSDAARDCRIIISRQPEEANGYNNLGIILAQQGLRKEAIEQFRHSIRLRPDQAQVYGNLGRVLMELNKFDDAAHMFSDAIRLDGNNCLMYNNLGEALLRQNDYKAAAEKFKIALQISPNYADAKANFVLTLSHLAGK